MTIVTGTIATMPTVETTANHILGVGMTATEAGERGQIANDI